MSVCPPAALPMAQGLPGSPGSRVSLPSRPLRLVVPMGWIGGR